MAPADRARPMPGGLTHCPVAGGGSMSGWVLPEEILRGAPTYTPTTSELADLELLLSGAYAPLTGFLTKAELAAVARRGRLTDGAEWPVPVTIELPEGLVEGL